LHALRQRKLLLKIGGGIFLVNTLAMPLCLSLLTILFLLVNRKDKGRFQTIGGDRMVGSLGKVAFPFRPTSRKRIRDRITTLRRQNVGTLCLTFGPDLGAWPECWVSVEFLHAFIPRKGSGSSTTAKIDFITASSLKTT